MKALLNRQPAMRLGAGQRDFLDIQVRKGTFFLDEIQVAPYSLHNNPGMETFQRGYSSGVEHSTADREVPGSIPGVPLFLLGYVLFVHATVNTDSESY